MDHSLGTQSVRRPYHALKEHDADILVKFFKKFLSFNPRNHDQRLARREWVNQYKHHKCLDALKLAYESGYGLKTIAAEVGLTYTVIRTVFNLFKIPMRKGMNVVTSKLQEIRSLNALTDDNPWVDWSRRRPDMHTGLHKATGLAGWYLDRKGRIIHLRSTFEYVIARYLDHKEYNWDNETISFSTPLGRYMPDFILFDASGNASIILEVKGTFMNEKYIAKSEWFKDFAKRYLKSIRFVIIRDMEPYMLGQKYHHVKQEWNDLRVDHRSI
jgi:hypothetical protein